MNFLAHFHLAWPDSGLLAGGLEGDYCKGPLRGELPADLERGIRLHRAIDAYTDAHPCIDALRRTLPAGLRRYAGILIDLGFDYCLTRHWSRFCALPLPVFNATVYRSLRVREADLSEASRRMLDRLTQHDLLGRYGEWATVTASAARIGQRFRRGNPFLDIDPELAPLRRELDQSFLTFYPHLQAYCAAQARQL